MLQKKLLICVLIFSLSLTGCASLFMSGEEKEKKEIATILQENYVPKYEQIINAVNNIKSIEDFFDLFDDLTRYISFSPTFDIYEYEYKTIRVNYRDFSNYGLDDYGTEFLNVSRNKLKQLGIDDIFTVSFTPNGVPRIVWNREIVREAIKDDDLSKVLNRTKQFARIVYDQYWFFFPEEKAPWEFAEEAFSIFLESKGNQIIKEGIKNKNLSIAVEYCNNLEEKYNLNVSYPNSSGYNPWKNAKSVFLARMKEEIQNGISLSDVEISEYLLAVVQQNIEVNDLLEAYDILSYLIQSPKSNQNSDVVSAYNDFIEKYGNNHEFQEDMITRSYSIFRNWDNLYGFKDSNGDVVIDPIFYSVTQFYDGLAFAQTFPDKAPCFINSKGKIVISFNQEDFSYYNSYNGENYVPTVLAHFNEGVCMISTVGGITYIDKTGKINTDFLNKIKRNNIEVTGRIFSNGLICAKDNNTGYYGYLDKNGDWAISPRYSYAYDFMQDGFAFVSYNVYDDGLAIIDVDGNSTEPFIFEDYSINDGVAILENYSLATILNLKTGDVLYYPINYLKINPADWKISYDVIDYYKLFINEGFFVDCTRYMTNAYSSDSTVKTNISVVNADGIVITSFDEDEEIRSIMPFENGKMRVGLVSGESYSVDYFGEVFTE